MNAKIEKKFNRLGGLISMFLVGTIFFQWGISWVSGQVQLRSDLVLLDVEIVNKGTGKRIGYLRREDFRVHEDGVQQSIVYFDRQDLPHRRRPLSVVLTVNPYDISKADVVKAIRRAARYAIDELWPEDKVALRYLGGG